MLTVCPLIDGAYPITSKEDAAATNPDVIAVDLRTGTTLATLTVAGGAVTSSGNFWICDLNHATASVVQTHLQRTQNSHVRLTWGMSAAGGGADQTEEIVSNTAEHDALLYPDGAIFADGQNGVSISSFSYGNGSKYEPVVSLENAAIVSVARNSPRRFRLKGNFGWYGTSGVNGALMGTQFSKSLITTDGPTLWWNQSGVMYQVDDSIIDGDITFEAVYGSTSLFYSPGTRFIGCKFRGSSSRQFAFIDGTFKDCTFESNVFASHTSGVNRFDFIECTFIKGASLNISTHVSTTPTAITKCNGDFTLNATVAAPFNVIGHIAGVITTSGTQPTAINLSGNYQLANTAGWTIGANVPVALRPDLVGNIINLAPNSITPTEAPNLDVAVSSVGGGGGGTDWTTTEKEQIRHRLSLDGTHAVPTSTHGDMYDLTTRLTATRASNLDNLDAAVSGVPTAAQNADAVWDEAYNAHTSAGTFGKLMDTLRKANFLIEATVNGTPTASAFDTTLTEVTGAHDSQIILFTSGTLLGESRPIDTYNATNGRIILQEALTAAPSAADEFVILPHHVHSISEIQNGLATSSALATVDANVDSLLVRLGADDVAIVKGLLLGNYVLDGGSGNTSAQYDSNGVMTAGRVRVFASSAAASGATLGAANGADSEIARVDVTASAVAGKAYPATVTGLLT